MQETKLHDQLRARLKATGATLAQIGAATGLAQSTIWRFMHGRTDLSLTNYVLLDGFCDSAKRRVKNSTKKTTRKATV